MLLCPGLQTRFPSSLLKIRVPFFLLFGFNEGTQKDKGQKGPYWETEQTVWTVNPISDLDCTVVR